MKQDDKGRTYLFVKDKGLLLLKNLVRSGDTWKTEAELFASPEYNYNQIGSFLIDRRGNFWLYEQFKSLIKISPEKKLSRFSESNGLPGLWFFRMIMDKEDNLWLALHGAISKINQTSFERFTSNEGLCFN